MYANPQIMYDNPPMTDEAALDELQEVADTLADVACGAADLLTRRQCKDLSERIIAAKNAL